MVRSIDEIRTDPASDAPVQLPSHVEDSMAREDSKADLYAEAELKLRHERTERFIQKAARELS